MHTLPPAIFGPRPSRGVPRAMVWSSLDDPEGWDFGAPEDDDYENWAAACPVPPTPPPLPATPVPPTPEAVSPPSPAPTSSTAPASSSGTRSHSPEPHAGHQPRLPVSVPPAGTKRASAPQAPTGAPAEASASKRVRLRSKGPDQSGGSPRASRPAPATSLFRGLRSRSALPSGGLGGPRGAPAALL